MDTHEISTSTPEPSGRRRHGGNAVAGVFLIVFGVLLLARHEIPWLRIHELWPLALVALGVYVIWKEKRR